MYYKSNNQFWIVIVFIFSLVSLLISLNLFYNLGLFVDEFNTSPTAVAGGDFWMYMTWLRLLLLFVVVAISGYKMVTNREIKKVFK